MRVTCSAHALPAASKERVRSAARSHYRRRYPKVGALLALGAPIGLLLTRSVASQAWPSVHWIVEEMASLGLIYAYVALSTAAILVLLGALLGVREDNLYAESLTDPLTSLCNRRHFDSRFQDELARARRYGRPLALLLLDVDRLKKINDLQGHAEGDRALRAVAEAISESCRETDIPARFGGDEFAILAPLTTAQEAAALAERVHANLRRLVSERAPLPTSWTLSIGIADVAEVGTLSVEAMSRAADGALYRAKARGGGRTEVGEVIATGAVLRPSS